MRRPISALMLSCAVVSALSGAARAEDGFFTRGTEGWYWYQDPPPKVEEPDPEVAEAPPPPVPEASPPEPVKAAPPPAPAAAPPPPGSVEFLRKAMPAALDVATDNPTKENVERYLLLQKLALDKSEIFAEVAKQVSTGHPELDEGRRRPRQDAFAKQLEEESEQRKREVLTDLFRTNALVMFLDRNCAGCSMMAENFFRMEKTHGLVWQAVSMDGTLLPPELATTQSFDAGLSEKLGVANGGAVFIAAPPNQFIPVTWNPTGGAEVADRILMVAARARLISEEAFQSTQAINPRVSEIGPIATGGTPDILKTADDYLRPYTMTLSPQEQR